MWYLLNMLSFDAIYSELLAVSLYTETYKKPHVIHSGVSIVIATISYEYIDIQSCLCRMAV